MPRDLHVVILAGGSGERFWPLSRKARPKQLLSLFSELSMLGETIARVADVVPAERIVILTNREQEAAVRAACPDFPAGNIVAEPAKRDTAPAVALGVGLVMRRDPEAVMAILPADHRIGDTDAFRRDLLAAARIAADSGALLTIGIRPTWACPGFGYIELGPRVGEGLPVIHEVTRFREKPDPETAASFLAQGNFRWNAGMFVWSVPSIMAEMARQAPELEEFVLRLCKVGDVPGYIAEAFPGMPKISVDYAIMEKAPRVLVMEAGFDWDDVGGWVAVSKYLPACDGGNASNVPLLAQEATDNIVFSSERKLVALAGVRDLIVIETADALLVCHRSEAEKIKNLVPRLPEELK